MVIVADLEVLHYMQLRIGNPIRYRHVPEGHMAGDSHAQGTSHFPCILPIILTLTIYLDLHHNLHRDKDKAHT